MKQTIFQLHTSSNVLVQSKSHVSKCLFCITSHCIDINSLFFEMRTFANCYENYVFDVITMISLLFNTLMLFAVDGDTKYHINYLADTGPSLREGQVGLSYRTGLNIMFDANKEQTRQYGMMAAFIRFSDVHAAENLLSLGTKLRISTFDINSTFGTVGYLGLHDELPTYFGINSRVDYNISERVSIGINTDYILQSHALFLGSLSLAYEI